MTRLLIYFIKASTLHIGAAAATASLRHDLVRAGSLRGEDVDRAYVVSRLTPGTNLLALYATLGHRLGGWSLAIAAVAVGVMVPATLAVVIAVAYVHVQTPMMSALMSGARTGCLAVFIGAAVRLARPQLAAHRLRGTAIGLALLAIAWTADVGAFTLLLVAGGVGALVLRR